MMLKVIVLTVISQLLVIQYTDANLNDQELNSIMNLIDNLNDRAECKMPSYDQVDEVSEIFKRHKGEKLSLNKDQRLLSETVLNRWDQFQQNMAFSIAGAKKRSFLGRVEQYQVKKHGFSVCLAETGLMGPNARLVRRPASGDNRLSLIESARGPDKGSIENFSKVSGIGVDKLREMGYNEQDFKIIGNTWMIMERMP